MFGQLTPSVNSILLYLPTLRFPGSVKNKENRRMNGIRQIVRVHGVDLAARVDGEEGRPWIVLANGLATTYDVWNEQVGLLDRTHRVLRYDARGHGHSSSPPGPCRFTNLEDDVIGLMDYFGIDVADLLGLSMGGMTMLGVAIDHSSRVNRLICCDARSDAVPPFIASWDARIAAIRTAGDMKGVVDFSLERWFTPAFREKKPETIKAAEAMILATDPEGYISCAAALKQLDFKRSLAKIAAPALFVCGAQDQAAAPAVMREIAALTPRGTYAEVDPGAHLCNMENPDRFNAIVGEWLGRSTGR
jgi:3-oxoadipate enol-lactonase